jgi:hypothetical protein
MSGQEAGTNNMGPKGGKGEEKEPMKGPDGMKANNPGTAASEGKKPYSPSQALEEDEVEEWATKMLKDRQADQSPSTHMEEGAVPPAVASSSGAPPPPPPPATATATDTHYDDGQASLPQATTAAAAASVIIRTAWTAWG